MMLFAANRLASSEKTFYVGVAPTDAREFVQSLNTSSQSSSLSHLTYSVLALGDSSYLHFCRAGRTVDNRLTATSAHLSFSLSLFSQLQFSLRPDSQREPLRILQDFAVFQLSNWPFL